MTARTLASAIGCWALIAPAAHAQDHDEHTRHSPSAGHADHSSSAADAASPMLPPITDADRKAAFPDLPGHAVHDRAIRSYVLFEKLEWQDAEDDNALTWEANGWIGGDVDRVWFRTEGERVNSRTESSEAHLLWGRHVSRWWDLVAGVRQDFEPGPAQTWAAFGVQGLAPYFFELEATAYLGEGGQTAARLEAEYELLLTNRLILQPLIEVELHGKNDSRRGIGSGFSSAEAGLRLRYEIRREIAPYIGLTWERKLGNSADLAELEGEDAGDTRFVAGLRIWF